jgi:aminoglycoside phosphotransferase (APT) family kinase protein
MLDGLPAQADDLLRQILTHTFGSAVQPEDGRILNHHPDYYVLFARLRHPSIEVSIKLASPQAPMDTNFDRTAYLHRLVAHNTHIPVADILAVDTSCTLFAWRYLIKTYVRGEEWAVVNPTLNDDQRRAAFRQLGQAVAELHSITFPAFGSIDAAGQGDAPAPYTDALRGHAQRIIKAPHLRDLFLSVLDRRADLFASVQTPQFCHDDLHHYNVLFAREGERWTLATILDFDKTWAGHAQSDLARLDLWTNMMGEGFREAYRAIIPPDDLYVLRRPVYQLLWCLEYAVPSPEHLETTRRICEKLGIATLAGFG